MTGLDRYQRIVLWGGRRSLDSSRHIYRAMNDTLRKLGYPVAWVDDAPASREHIRPGCLVYAWNIWGTHIGPAVDGVDYVLHNFDGGHELCRSTDRILRIQVYTDGAAGEQWDPVRLFERDGRVLFQPWGTDLLAEEFMDPVSGHGSREVCFVGAVWDDRGMGNKATSDELWNALASRGLRFIHLTQVSDAEMVAAVRRSRFAPAFAGPWQVEHNYLPCRVFKNVSYGALGVTNVAKLQEILPGSAAWARPSIEETIDRVLSLRAGEYMELVREQQRTVARYTYRESLAAIGRAIEELWP